MIAYDINAEFKELFAQIMRNMVLKVFLFHESNLYSETIIIEWKEPQYPGFNSCLCSGERERDDLSLSEQPTI